MPYAEAMNKTLVFAIFDFDRFSKHDQIGEVKVPLCQIDLAQTIEEWRELQSVEGEGGQVISQSNYKIGYSPVNWSGQNGKGLKRKKSEAILSSELLICRSFRLLFSELENASAAIG